MGLVIGFDFQEDAFRRERLIAGTKCSFLDWTQLKQVLL